MANIKISAMTPLATMNDTALIPVVDGSSNKRITGLVAKTYTSASPILTGTPSSTGIFTINYVGSADSSLVITGSNTRGGAGYHDFLVVKNGAAGATNTNKSFRLNSTGGFEILNSAYSVTLLELSDAGQITVKGSAVLNLNSASPSITTTGATASVFNANVLTGSLFGAATTISIGAGTGTTTVNNDLTVAGNLTVKGITTTVNSSTLTVDDKNLELGSVAAVPGFAATLTTGTAIVTLAAGTTNGLIPGMSLITTSIGGGEFGSGAVILTVDNLTQITASVTHAVPGSINFDIGGVTDLTANGGGITLKGATNKTIIWEAGNTNWSSSEHWNIATGKSYKINNVPVLTSTAVLNDPSQTNITVGGSASTIGIGAATGTMTLNNATVTIPGQLISTRASALTDGTGQLYLNGATGNRIDWNTNGTGAPTFTTRSVGSKIVLYPITNATNTDYAIGIDSGTFWSSVPQNDTALKFKWYGGITEIASIDGVGNQILTGDLAVNGGDITTNQTTFNLLNTTATTVNFAGAATTIGIGASTGTTTINNNLTVTGTVSLQTGTTVKDVRDTVYTGGATTGTITPNCANGNIQTITLTGSITLNAFASPVSGQSLTMIITQPASGGPYTLTSSMKFAGGTKTLSTAANAIDMLTISYVGTTYYASLVTGFA